MPRHGFGARLVQNGILHPSSEQVRVVELAEIVLQALQLFDQRLAPSDVFGGLE